MQNRKILRVDVVQTRAPLLVAGPPQNLEAPVVAVLGRRGVGRNARRNHFRQGRDVLTELLEIVNTILPTDACVLVHRNAHGHDVLRIVAEIGVDNAHKAVNRCSRRGKQKQRERNLPHDQYAVRPFSFDAACGAPRLHEYRERLGRENWKAGEIPASAPVTMAAATLNASTGRFIRMTTSCGKEYSGSQLTSTESKR